MPGMHVGRHTGRCRGARVVQCRSLLDTAGRDAVLAKPEGGWDGCPGWVFVRCSGRRTRWDWSVCWEGGAPCLPGVVCGNLEGGRLGVVSPWACFMSEGRGRWYQGWTTIPILRAGMLIHMCAGLDDVLCLMLIPLSLSLASFAPDMAQDMLISSRPCSRPRCVVYVGSRYGSRSFLPASREHRCAAEWSLNWGYPSRLWSEDIRHCPSQSLRRGA